MTWPIGGILAIAAFLRLFRLNFGEYQWDDDGIWSLAVNAVTQHTLPAKGIHSTLGTGNGPFQVYLMMPFAAVTHDPLAGMIGVALLNVAAVYFAYRFVREFFGQRSALIAALLFAVNSWSVMYSRHLAVQGMLIPFQVLFFWSAARWLARGRGLDLVLAFLWLAIATQTYIDGLVHLGSMAVLLALGWRRLRLGPLLGGLAVWAGLSAYYLIAVVVGEWRFLAPELSGDRIFDLSSVQFALLQALHIGFELLAPQTQAPLQPVASLETAVSVVEGALFVGGVAYGAWRLVNHIRERRAATTEMLLFVWLLIPIGVYLRHQDILTWRHLVLIMPLPAIFSGLVLARFWPRVGAPLLAGLTANSLGLAGVFFSVIPTCVGNNVYALPYQQTFDLAGSVERLARDSGAQRVYIYGRPSLGPILGSILDRDGFDAQWVDTSHGSSLALAAPGGPPAAYVSLDDASGVGRALRAGLSGQQAMEQPIPCEDMTLRSYVVRPEAVRSAVEPLLPAELGLRTANGIAIQRIGTERRLQPGGNLSLVIEWTRSGTEPATLFTHLVDPNGRQISGSDRPLSSGTAGLEWQDLAVPAGLLPGRYFLELGLYGDGDRRLSLIDGSDTSMLWGPLVVASPPASEASLTPADVRFGDAIGLSGYRAGADGLVLRWQALAQPRADYTVFVHAIDGSGRVVAQADSQPLAGDFPTGTWRAGETIIDRHPLSLPPGRYTIEVGLYELGSLQRLPGGPLDVQLTVS